MTDTKRLVRHYPGFSPDERFGLLLAAACRGDATEVRRLTDAAPRVRFAVPDTYFHGPAFRAVADHEQAVRLELAALYARAVAAVGMGELDMMVGDAEAPDRPDADRAEDRARVACRRRTARMLLYLLRAHRDGFAAWVRGLGGDPDAANLTTLPGADTLAFLERDELFEPLTAEEVLAAVRDVCDPDAVVASVVTAESVAAGLHARFRAEVAD